MYSLPVRLLLDGSFGSGSLVNVLSWFFAFGTFFNGVQYRVFTLGYGPVEIGLSCMSMAILSIVVGALGPRLARRQGGRAVLVAGLVLMAAGSIGIAAAATTAAYWPLAIAEVLAFGGLGLAGGPATEAIVDALPDTHQGVASAVNDTTREMGVAIGVALMGSVFNLAYRASISDNPHGLPAEAVEATRDSPIAGFGVAAQLPPETASSHLDLVRDSVSTGFSSAMLAGAVIRALGAIAVLIAHPKDRPQKAKGTAPAYPETGQARVDTSG